MGSYLDKLGNDMKTAMKSGNKPRLEVLRMLISDLKKKAIDTQVDALKDEDELVILQKAVKSRQDSVAQAKAAGRAEFAANEQAEIEVITSYLPKQMGADEVKTLVAALAKEIGYAGSKDIGRFMKEWMARHKGVADGRMVQETLKALG
ncbi:MAG TPA: GatB/YqeY domain-containing protein [Planctomycetota bacterium]|nr:GatB/YqeY domain-containing protein [Planctomycetota bacterium]